MTTPRVVVVTILVETQDGDVGSDRLIMSEGETGAAFVERVALSLASLGGYGDGALSDERRFVQMARLVAQHWQDQEGINSSHLDDLVNIYRTLNKEKSDG